MENSVLKVQRRLSEMFIISPVDFIVYSGMRGMPSLIAILRSFRISSSLCRHGLTEAEISVKILRTFGLHIVGYFFEKLCHGTFPIKCHKTDSLQVVGHEKESHPVALGTWCNSDFKTVTFRFPAVISSPPLSVMVWDVGSSSSPSVIIQGVCFMFRG